MTDTENPSWNQPKQELPIIRQLHTKCEFCPKPATHCYRDGAGTGNSEHVCACVDHQDGGGWV